MNGTNGGTGSALKVSGGASGASLVDDLIRRTLRVGEITPKEIAAALLRRYPEAANKLNDERAGFSTGVTPTLFRAELQPDGGAGGETAGDREYARIRGDLEADLNGLIRAPGNREWKPELTGWQSALLRELSDGAAAARFAADPARRERAFFAVRRLGEYARLARLVGVMNLELNPGYRRLAATLDGAANDLRILMGEAIYDAGLADGGQIIQVPLTDLRQRRDALMASLRRLTGVTEDDSGDGDWGEDAAAYGQLLLAVEKASAPELKVYLRAEMLGPLLDALVGSVSRQDPEALRQLAATAPVEVNRLNRLYAIASTQVTGALKPGAKAETLSVSPGLSAFTQALRLFLDAFDQSRSGARLVDLAVPLPLAASQARRDQDRDARSTLRELVNLRGSYAAEVECYLNCCGCELDGLKTQVKLDKVLYDVDRAIDLYAQGTGFGPNDWGDEEKRAGVYGVFARNLAEDRSAIADEVALPLLLQAARAGIGLLESVATAADGRRTEDAQSAKDADPARCRQIAADLADTLDSVQSASAASPLAEADLRGLERLGVKGDPVAGTPGTTAPAVTEARDLGAGLPIWFSLYALETVVGGLVDAMNASNDVIIVGIDEADAPSGLQPTTLHDFADSQISSTFVGGVVPLSKADIAAQTALAAAVTAIRTSIQSLDDDKTKRDLIREKQLQKAADAAKRSADAIAAISDDQPDTLHPMLIAAQTAALDAWNVARAALAIADQGTDAQPTVLWEVLEQIAGRLVPVLDQMDPTERTTLEQSVLTEQLRAEDDWAHLVGALAPRCLGPGRAELVNAARELIQIHESPDGKGGGGGDLRIAEAEPLGRARIPLATRVGIERLVADVDDAIDIENEKENEEDPGKANAASAPALRRARAARARPPAGGPEALDAPPALPAANHQQLSAMTAAAFAVLAERPEVHQEAARGWLRQRRAGAEAKAPEAPRGAKDRWNDAAEHFKRGFTATRPEPAAPAAPPAPGKPDAAAKHEAAPPATPPLTAPAAAPAALAVLPLEGYHGAITVRDGEVIRGWPMLALPYLARNPAAYIILDEAFASADPALDDEHFRLVKATQLRQVVHLLNMLAAPPTP